MANAFHLCARDDQGPEALPAGAGGGQSRGRRTSPRTLPRWCAPSLPRMDCLPIQNGLYCAENTQCASNYCDRPRRWHLEVLAVHAGARAAAPSSRPCTNDNQCESSHCSGLARGVDGGWVPGHCEAPVFIGQPCATNSQCATRYCDRGDGTGHTGLCMKGDGTATEGEPCSNNNQCISLNCTGLTTDAAGNWIPGRCTAKAALGQFCRQDLDCASGDCDVDEGDAGSMMCTPPNATGRTNDLCTQHSQCASGLCALLSTGANGLPIPGRCGTTGGDIGAACTGNAECTSGYCDRGDGTSKTSLCLPSRGTGPLGTLCSHDNQCASGICGGLTQNSSGNWIPGRCAVAGPLGAACFNHQQCASGYCDAGWGTSKTNRCMPRGATGTTGQLCSNDNQCASSNCSGLAQNIAGEWVPGTCGAKLGLGMTCYANYLCSSGYCDRGDGTSKTSKCMPAAGAGTIGQTCSHDNQCATANCAGLRQDSYYNWLPGSCAAKRVLGNMCTTNGQCASTYCDAGDGTSKTSQCMPRGRTGTPGQICSHNNQCVSGTCSGLAPNPNGTWTPGSCM